MNLNKLFPIQAELDNRIVKKFGLEGQDLLPKKILALQVELGELANEARFFKFWSEDQKPRTKVGCGLVRPGEWRNPLLEEYVDCLHFILSIGLERHYTYVGCEKWKVQTITQQFMEVAYHVSNFYYGIESDWHEDEILDEYQNVVSGFLGLGEMLGFTWEEVENAYLEKNKVNHARQESGY